MASYGRIHGHVMRAVINIVAGSAVGTIVFLTLNLVSE